MNVRRPMVFDVALEGGGSKGIALSAALAELVRRGHGVRRVVGTSAGAIAAALLAAGVSAEELAQMSLARTEEDLPLFSEYVREPLIALSPLAEPSVIDDELIPLALTGDAGRSLVAARSALALLDRGGIVSGNGLVDWISGVLEERERGLSLVTFRELYRRSGMHLTIITTDTTTRRLRALNHVTAPDCPVVAAVRMSVSIPLLFTEVVWRAEWGTYLGEPIAGHVMVDGGMLSNLPIAFVMPGANRLLERVMGPSGDARAIPLGIVLDADLPVRDAPPISRGRLFAARTIPELLADTRFGRRIAALADTMLRGNDQTIAEVDDANLLRLPVGGYGVTEFDMSAPRAAALTLAARRAAGVYLDDLERRLASQLG